MGIASSLVNGISIQQPSQIGQGLSGYDLNDTTFSDLLEKQMNIEPTENKNNDIFASLGMPVGLQIQNLDGSEFTLDEFAPIDEIQKTENNPIEHNNSEILLEPKTKNTSESSFFSSILDNNSLNNKTELFDFAKKTATQAYDKFGKNLVENLNDLISDIK